MGMGDDDKLYLLRGEPILFHLMKDLLQVARMPRIDEDCLLAMDDISITVVFVGILPKIGIKVFFEFHHPSFW
jgi:hypothetical protein